MQNISSDRWYKFNLWALPDFFFFLFLENKSSIPALKAS